MAFKSKRARLTGGGASIARHWVDGDEANTDIPVPGITRSSQVIFAFEWDSSTAAVANDLTNSIVLGNGVVQFPESTDGNSVEIMFVSY